MPVASGSRFQSSSLLQYVTRLSRNPDNNVFLLEKLRAKLIIEPATFIETAVAVTLRSTKLQISPASFVFSGQAITLRPPQYLLFHGYTSAVAAVANVVTFSSVAIGEARSGRLIVVFCYSDGSGFTTSSATIGGVAASVVENGLEAAYYAVVSSGSTATIVIDTGVGGSSKYSISVYSLYGVSSTLYDSAIANGSSSGAPIAIDVDVLNKSLLLSSVISTSVGAGTCTLVGVTEDQDFNATDLASSTFISSGSFAPTATEAPRSVTFQVVGGTADYGMALAFRDLSSGGAFSIIAGAASFILSGQVVILAKSSKLVANTATFSFSGQLVVLKKGFKLIASLASFALTGQGVNLIANRKLAAAAASFILSGQDVVIRGGKFVAAATATFVFSSQDVRLATSRKLLASSAAFILSGQTILFKVTMPAEAANFSLLGLGVNLKRAYTLVASPFALTISYKEIGLGALITTSNAVYLTALAIGSADPVRTVILAVGYSQAAPPTLKFYFNGSLGRLISRVDHIGDGGTNQVLEVWAADIPTGTTCDITANTLSGAVTGSKYAVYTVSPGAAIDLTSAIYTQSVNTAAANFTVDINPFSAALGFCLAKYDALPAWTGLTKDADHRGSAGVTPTLSVASQLSTNAIAAESVSCTIDGSPQNHKAGIVISIRQRGFVGSNVNLQRVFPPLAANAATYVYTGNSVFVRKAFYLPASFAVFTLSGQNVIFNVSLPVSPGSFILTGRNVSFGAINILADKAVFTLTPLSIDFLIDSSLTWSETIATSNAWTASSSFSGSWTSSLSASSNLWVPEDDPL